MKILVKYQQVLIKSHLLVIKYKLIKLMQIMLIKIVMPVKDHDKVVVIKEQQYNK
jgi:hypothetical protein